VVGDSEGYVLMSGGVVARLLWRRGVRCWLWCVRMGMEGWSVRLWERWRCLFVWVEDREVRCLWVRMRVGVSGGTAVEEAEG